MVEIERKYLVKSDDFLTLAYDKKRIIQGYLNSHPERNVRVRIIDNKGLLNIKGLGDVSGTTRFEVEYEIPIDEAKETLKICEAGIIDKTRYLIDHGKHTIEVDVFHGDNEGLTLAEIELEEKDENFDKPDWLGDEVTTNYRYYNASLIKKPFKDWD